VDNVELAVSRRNDSISIHVILLASSKLIKS
jgi:hypothetical protein